MITLTIVFCVVGDVSACQRTRQPVSSPFACAMAQITATDWLEDHPAYRVARIECGRAA